MSLVEKEKDLIGFANKVISFRMNVIKACKAKGIKPPTNEQITNYIYDYGFYFEDFMADYTEHEGMFRGLTSYSPLEQKTLDATLKLDNDKLRELWNTFVDESGIYGEDSFIYDLSSERDFAYLDEQMTSEEVLQVCGLVINKNARYIQWLCCNDNSIIIVNDIKAIIKAYWGEIFKRIMLYPRCYGFDVQIYDEGNGSTYFDDVFFPIIAEEVGYKIDGGKGTFTKIEK